MRYRMGPRTLATIALAIGLMGVMIADTSGSVPSMDMDLGDSSASFLGEATYHYSGYSVAGAGDVNGDGYDDILIGSLFKDNEGNSRGQTYLIFGNASGWSMDTHLSAADASFWGESPWDHAGESVAGAGDVNGDGYDDIVIGAPKNDDGGSSAGQTYLILGKASGWTMDSSLSLADASFWGEESMDQSGHAVAGAGDVNGDGYDDILISASYNDETISNAGQTYLILGKASGWTMDTDLANADASFLGEYHNDKSGSSIAGAGDVNGDGYDDILIGAYEQDEGGGMGGQTYLILGKASGWSMDTNLSDADASFLGEDWGDDSGYSIAGAGDVNGDGYDDILIGAIRDSDGGYYAGQTYLILGKESGWSVDTNLSESDASFWGEETRDNSGLAVAGAGDVNGDGYDDILISANYFDDNNGTFGPGQTYLILAKASGWSMDTNLSDANASFWGEYWADISGWSIACAGDVNGDGYDDILIGASGNDEGGDRAGQTYLIFYDDGAPPEMGNDSTPTVATTGDELTFTISVMDNIELTSVRVEYWYGEARAHTNVSMTRDTGDLWRHSIVVPSDSINILHYFFYARDNTTNIATTGTRDVPVLDNDRPVFEEDPEPMDATTGEDLIIYIQVEDNIGVAGVWMHYRYGDDAHSNETMINSDGGLWETVLEVDHTLEDIQHRMGAVDTSGNVNWTSWRTVDVIDNDPPEVVEDLSDEVPTTGDVYYLRVRVWDNIGIASVSSIAPWIAIDVDENGNGVYEFEIPIEADYVGMFYLDITITDTSGNEAYFELASREVVDDDAPMIVLQGVIEEAIKGTELRLEPVGMDNIGVESLYIVYHFGDGSATNETVEDDVLLLTIPRHIEGTLQFHFTAVDASGNWGTSGAYSLPLVNEPPDIAELPTWDVLEETDAEFDLAPHVTDVNDNEFTVVCSDENVMVEGHVLKVRHDAMVPNYSVTLTVSDGEDEVDVELTIHVVNVNDPPVISDILPADGTNVREGKKIVLSIFTEDEEDDELTVTWKDGDVVLGTGSSFEVKFKPGEHTITVLVDDGTDKVEESFTLIVKKEEESPGPGLVAALAAVVLAGFVMVRRRR